MNQPSEELLPLIELAVQQRAAGSSWDAVAAKVGHDAQTCRGWPAAYPDVWRRLYRQAERHVLAEAGAEAVAVLRTLLRSKGEKTPLAACALLLKSRGDDRDPPEGPADDAIAPFVAHLKELDDAQLDALVEAHRTGVAATGGGPAGAADPRRPDTAG
jgi:hypothetical protein